MPSMTLPKNGLPNANRTIKIRNLPNNAFAQRPQMCYHSPILVLRMTMTTPTYSEILSVVADDFAVMDKQVFGSLNSKVQLIMKVSDHVINAGGKRMRPLMTLLISRMIKDEQYQPSLELGALTERRDTARRVQCDIAEGVVLQLQHQHNIETTESDYLQIIDGKTSRLFMMACVGSALLHGKHDDKELLANLSDFGQHFGNAFQMIDDVLDFMGDSQTMGKNLGDDLAEGKPTLPIIKTLEILKQSNSDDYDKLRIAVQTGKTDNAETLIGLVKSSGALEYCKNRALDETRLAQTALMKLPDNKYRHALYQLTQLASARLV